MQLIQRESVPAIPENFHQVLNAFQLQTLKKVEEFGGQLWFIRRPLFQDVIPVVKCAISSEATAAIIEHDGTLNRNHGLNIRPDKLH